MPKVSVILTSFNHAKFLREAIDSVLTQTYTDFELIIWDDASSDDSWNIIQSYDDPRIKTFRNEVRKRDLYGLKKAISAGIATGDYLAIHHSDDVWHNTKIEKQVAFLDTHKNYGAVFTHAMTINEHGAHLNKDSFYKTIFDQPNRTRHQWLRHFFFTGNVLCHPSLLIRRQCYEDCDLYRDGMAQLSDLDMWVRLCLKHEIHILPEKLVYYRILNHETNSSGYRVDTINRSFIEFGIILENFLNITSYDDLVAIFPEAKIYGNSNGCVPEFILSMMALSDPTSPWTKLFGMKILFDLISDAQSSKKIKELYGFDHFDLIEITGKHDIFSHQALAYVQTLENELDTIKKSYLWKALSLFR